MSADTSEANNKLISKMTAANQKLNSSQQSTQENKRRRKRVSSARDRKQESTNAPPGMLKILTHNTTLYQNQTLNQVKHNLNDIINPFITGVKI